MGRFGSLALFGGLMGAAVLAAPAGARAQGPISQYICLTNACFMPSAPGAQGAAPGRPGTGVAAPTPAAPARAAPMTPQALQQMQAGMQAGLQERLLDGLTDEQRATARWTPMVDGDRVGMQVEFTNPNGMPGRRSITINPNPLAPR